MNRTRAIIETGAEALALPKADTPPAGDDLPNVRNCAVA